MGTKRTFVLSKCISTNNDVGAEKLLTCTNNRNGKWVKSDAIKVMTQVIKLKFEQVSEFKEFVIKHKDKTFVEATRNTKWGIGLPINSEDIYDPLKWKGATVFVPINLDSSPTHPNKLPPNTMSL